MWTDSQSHSARSEVAAEGITAAQVDSLVMEIASEVTGHSVDPQDSMGTAACKVFSEA